MQAQSELSLSLEDAHENNQFGRAVAINANNQLFIGALTKQNGDHSGAVYLYEQQEAQLSWTLSSTLIPANNSRNDYFGATLKANNKHLLIAAPQKSGKAIYGGSVYLYRSNDNKQWQAISELTPADLSNYALFGSSLDLQENTAIIGALGDNTNGFKSGAAYVYRIEGNQTTVVQKLLPTDGQVNDEFGKSVAIVGNQILVGAWGATGNYGLRSGAVYLFNSNDDNNTWTQQQKLLPTDSSPNDYFGWAIASDGNIAVIGAPRHDGRQEDAGAVYVYQKVGGEWLFWQKLQVRDAKKGAAFGSSLAIQNGRIIVGAMGDSQQGYATGAVYVFILQEGNWVQKSKQVAKQQADIGSYGAAMALNDNKMLIGAFTSNSYEQARAGRAFVYDFCETPLAVELDIMENDHLYQVSAATTGGTAPYTYRWNTATPIRGEVANNLAAGYYTLSVTDKYNCQQTQHFVLGTPNDSHLKNMEGADSHALAANWVLHPNPSKGGIAILESKNNVMPKDIAIFDNKGNTVAFMSEQAANSINIRLTTAKAGIYHIRLYYDTHTVLKKWIVVD